jgi:hypothetical protein
MAAADSASGPTADLAVRRRPSAPPFETIEDPRVRIEFVTLLAEQHHALGDPYDLGASCSCGQPYHTCPVRAEIEPLLAVVSPARSAGPSHWFG